MLLTKIRQRTFRPFLTNEIMKGSVTILAKKIACICVFPCKSAFYSMQIFLCAFVALFLKQFLAQSGNLFEWAENLRLGRNPPTLCE